MSIDLVDIGLSYTTKTLFASSCLCKKMFKGSENKRYKRVKS